MSFICQTCSFTDSAENVMKHLSNVRHKTVIASNNDELACEECSDTNIHMLKIIRFGGDDMRLLCNSCFNKGYTEDERPSTFYSLSNGTILKFWDRYQRVRDCCCDACGKEDRLNVAPSGKVLCDSCLQKNPKQSNTFVSENSGQFLYVLLGIKDAGKTPARKGKFKRKIGRGGKGGRKQSKKPSRRNDDGDDTAEKKMSVTEKINKVSNLNRIANTKIESSNNITLSTFVGKKAPSQSVTSSQSSKNSLNDRKRNLGRNSNDRNTTHKESSRNTKGTSKISSTAKGKTPDRNSSATRKPNTRSSSNESRSTSRGGQRESNKSRSATKDYNNKNSLRSGEQISSTSINTERNKDRNKSKYNNSKSDEKKTLNRKLDNSSKPPKNNRANTTGGIKDIGVNSNKVNTNNDKQNDKTRIAKKDDNKRNIKKDENKRKDRRDDNKRNDKKVEKKRIDTNLDKKNNNAKDTSTLKDLSKRDGLSSTKKNIETSSGNELMLEEGVVHNEYQKYKPKLSFNDLNHYCQEFSNAIFLEQKLENDFIQNFKVSWPVNPNDNLFVIIINMKNNEEIDRIMTPLDVKLKKVPFPKNSPLIFCSNDESSKWYTFIKDSAMKGNQITLLVELFGWNSLALPIGKSSDDYKFLPVSASARRVLFAMTRINNPTFIDMLLGKKPIKQIHFNNRIKFTSEQFNDSQRTAIQNVLNNKVTILQGPPGTGKTATIEEIILQMREHFNSFPILCVAASNIAIDNIAEKFIEKRPDIKILRIVSKSKEREYNMDHPLGEICLHNIVYGNLSEESRKVMGYLAMGKTSAFSKNALKRYFQEREGIVNRYINQYTIIFATNVAAGSNELKVINEIPVVIMDESTQSSEVSTLIPLSLPGIKTFVFVGDDKQLSSFSDIPQLSLSLFERILMNGTYKNPDMLNTQYRMHPIISEFPRSTFYNKTLLDGVSPEQKQLPNVAYPLYFYDYKPSSNNREQLHRVRRRDVVSVSYYNEHECDMIMEIIHMLKFERGIELHDIGVITPYAGQREQLSARIQGDELINPEKLQIEKQSEEKDLFSVNEQSMGSNNTICIINGLQVSTIDAFQGHEKSVIIFSCVRNNTKNTIGFLNDRRRLNVALTRAKNSLIIVGCSEFLANTTTSQLWSDYITYLKNNHLIHATLREY
ncbi:putative ATP-dependent RNA helicase ECM32 [Nakaseomyces bracarensis]|uniref:ATP-dependent RNA helicase ECM32 n=1 Tax=Nakaseomyces bracarensis TaxID=273131 RepID=A0ABR4NX94_9SACH